MHPPRPALRPASAARRLALRLAMLALLAAALLPTFGRLLQPAGLGEWAALCQTARGDAPPPGTHDHGDVCPLCSLAHTTPTLVGAATPAIAVVAFAPPPPAALAAAPMRGPRTRAPTARGPPSLA